MQLSHHIIAEAFAAHSRRDATAKSADGAPAKLPGEQRPEFQYPSSHRLVGDVQTSLGEQIFNVAVAEGKAKVEPHRAPDDRGRKLVAGKRDRRHSLS